MDTVQVVLAASGLMVSGGAGGMLFRYLTSRIKDLLVQVKELTDDRDDIYEKWRQVTLKLTTTEQNLIIASLQRDDYKTRWEATQNGSGSGFANPT